MTEFERIENEKERIYQMGLPIHQRKHFVLKLSTVICLLFLVWYLI